MSYPALVRIGFQAIKNYKPQLMIYEIFDKEICSLFIYTLTIRQFIQTFLLRIAFCISLFALRSNPLLPTMLFSPQSFGYAPVPDICMVSYIVVVWKEGGLVFETGLVLVFGYCCYCFWSLTTLQFFYDMCYTRNGCDDVVRPHAINSHLLYLLKVLIS